MDEQIKDTPVKTEVLRIGNTEFTVNSLESKSAQKGVKDLIKHLILSNLNHVHVIEAK